MPTYRIYFMSEGANISRPPEVTECSNDREAAEEARRHPEAPTSDSAVQ